MRIWLAGMVVVGGLVLVRCAGPATSGGTGGNGSGGWGGYAGSGGGGSGGSAGGDGGDGSDLGVPIGPVTPRGAPYDNASESVHALAKVLDLKGSYGVAIAGGQLIASDASGGSSFPRTTPVSSTGTLVIPSGATVKYALLWYGGAIFMKPGDGGAAGDYTSDVGGALDTASDVQGNGITFSVGATKYGPFDAGTRAAPNPSSLGAASRDLASRVSAALRHLDQRQGVGLGQPPRRHRRLRGGDRLRRRDRQSAGAARSERQRRHVERRQPRRQHHVQLVLGRGGVGAPRRLRAAGGAGEEPGAHGRRLGARVGLPLLPLGQVGAAQGAHRPRADSQRRQVYSVHSVGRAGGRGAAGQPDLHLRLWRLVHTGAHGPVAELVLHVDVHRFRRSA